MPEPTQVHIIKDNPVEFGQDVSIPTPPGEDWTLNAVQVVEVEHGEKEIYYVWTKE